MEWYWALLLLFGILVLAMMLGIPVAFSFLIVIVIGIFLWWGGLAGLRQLTYSIFESVTSFILVPLPLFILMGEVTFHSGIGTKMLNVLDNWLGRLPGRLGLLAVGGGVLLSTLTGVAVGSVAMLGSALVPEMEKRGYKKPMSLGPILGSSGLAVMIPPSALAVFLGAIAFVSIGRLLIAIIIPGLLMAILYGAYIVVRCRLQPHIAPAYDVPPTPLLGKLLDTVRYILPVGLVIFMVVGVIILGIASPSEAAATGTVACFVLAALYGGLSWEMITKSVSNAVRTSVMVFMIMIGAVAFSKILAFSGAGPGLVAFVTGFSVGRIFILIGMQVIVLFLGMFMTTGSVIMITIPLYMPIVQTLGFDPLWFAVIFLLNLEMAQTTPPYGISLFVMKAVAPPGTSLKDCYLAALPFLYCDLIAMVLIIAFPSIALWLPGLMR